MIGAMLTALVVVAFALGVRVGRDREALATGLIAALSEGEASASALFDRLHREGMHVRIVMLYPRLRELERLGVVTSREVPGGPARGGRGRIVYRLKGAA